MARLHTGGGLEGDRAFAFQFLDETVPAELRATPAESAPWMSKVHLAEQHDWPMLARLVPHVNGDRLRIECDGTAIEESVVDAAGRDRLAQFVFRFLSTTLPYEHARHAGLAPLRLLGSADLAQRYTDGARGPVTLGSVATFDDLRARFGAGVDHRSFRLNLIVEGAAPWEELQWIGRRLRVGAAVLDMLKPVGRCPNIDVHPETGARHTAVYPGLKPAYGHALTGVRCEVIHGGTIRIGDVCEFV